MHLLHTASIGHTSLAHVWVTNVVVRAISTTVLVFRADVSGRRVRKVVIDFVSDVLSEEAQNKRAGKNARIWTSMLSNSATFSFKLPSACSERKWTTCSSYHEQYLSPPRDRDGNIDPGPTYAHLTVIKRIDVLERVNSRGLDTRLSKEWEDAQGGAVTKAEGSLYDARLFLNWGMGGN